MAKFCKGVSGNPGGRPKVLGEVQELARLHAPSVIVELARLALKAKSETARIAAIRELLARRRSGTARTYGHAISTTHPDPGMIVNRKPCNFTIAVTRFRPRPKPDVCVILSDR